MGQDESYGGRGGTGYPATLASRKLIRLLQAARAIPPHHGGFFCLQTSVTTLRGRNCAKIVTAQGSPSSASRINPESASVSRVPTLSTTLLDDDIVVTTDAVFTELLAALSAAGPYLRQEAVKARRGLTR